MSELIQRLVVDHLHIVGDIFDRGPGPHIIMDTLIDYHSVDIQWGNHDVVWMGASAGQTACIANVIRNSARYGNLDILEDGYGINLLPLATFAMDTYRDDPCERFKIKTKDSIDDKELSLERKLNKAITVIQFKLEGQLIREYPEFEMEDRMLLHRIDFETGMVELYGKKYPMADMNLPTVDPADPYALTEEEEHVMARLQKAFVNCEKLQKHTRFLLAKGGLYKVYNNNLLYHGCVPLNADGSIKKIQLFGKTYRGKEWYEALDSYMRKGFFALDPAERKKGCDMMWYIWCNPNSPLFGKDRMVTFENCFVDAPETHVENKNPYYALLEDEEVVNRIIREFGLDPETAHIVNGHVPVKCVKGESPIKGHGKVLIIDGGFSKAYQKVTGIAGYTLIYNSYGMRLVAHDPFESTEAAIEKESDIHSETTIVQQVTRRLSVGDTDEGRKLKERIQDLELLLEAYRSGDLIEK
jgi:fructose-1,6-bisphosphatase-3